MRRNDKDTSHSQRLGQVQKFGIGVMESAAFSNLVFKSAYFKSGEAS